LFFFFFSPQTPWPPGGMVRRRRAMNQDRSPGSCCCFFSAPPPDWCHACSAGMFRQTAPLQPLPHRRAMAIAKAYGTIASSRCLPEKDVI
jgi:hypothetical protein